MGLTLWGTIYATNCIALRGLTEVLRIFQEEEASSWIEAYKRAEYDNSKLKTDGVLEDAKRFWTTVDSNDLMNFYYRGFPLQIIKAFNNEINFNQTLRDQKCDWMAELFDSAHEDCLNLVKSIPEASLDLNRYHRLHAFPILLALQLLPHSDRETGKNLCWRIGTTLSKILDGTSGYTESAADQLAQIIPQILTEQLRVGNIAWHNFVITDDLLTPLIKIGNNRDIALRFSTAVGLSLQFLVYYRDSLNSKQKDKRYKEICRSQSETIDRYLNDIINREVTLDDSFVYWVDALQGHVLDAKQKKGVSSLVPQSSSVLIARRVGSHEVPAKLWHLSALNNLRAAHASINLPDNEDRRKRIIKFFQSNNITSNDGVEIVENYIHERDFMDDMMEFVTNLPSTYVDALSITPEDMVLSTELTIDDVWSELSNYRTWVRAEKAAVMFSFSPGEAGEFVSKLVNPVIKRWLKKTLRGDDWKQTRIQKLKTMFQEIAEQEMSENSIHNRDIHG